MINIKHTIAGLSLVTASLLYSSSTDGTYTNVYGVVTDGGNVMSDSTYSNYGVLSQVPNRVVATDGTYSNYAKLEILNGGDITTPAAPTPTPTPTVPDVVEPEIPVIVVPPVVEPTPEPEIPVVIPTPEPELPVVEEPKVIIEEIIEIKEVINKSKIEKQIDEDVTKKDTGITLDEDGRKDKFTLKEDAIITINEDGGSEVRTEVVKENGETVETIATVNTNGTLEASLKTDADQKGVTLKSSNTDTQVEVKDDGSIEMTFDLKDTTDLQTNTTSGLDTDKEIIGSLIKAIASDDPQAIAGSIIELKFVDTNGNEELVETKTVSKVQNSSVIITDEGTVQTEAQSSVTLQDENGEDKAVEVVAVVQADKFGKSSSELTITDTTGKETIVSFESELAGTTTDINEDGSLETKATLGSTEVATQITPDGKTTSSVTIQVVNETTGESRAVELKTSSDLEGAKTTLAKDGSVETTVATKVEALDADGITQEIDIALSVKGDTSGESTHSIVARDTEGVVLFETKATSELKGAETKITSTGALETKASITNDVGEVTELKIETNINGNTTHTVSTTDANGEVVNSLATSKIQGASTVIKEDGNIETKASPAVFKIEGKTIEAIVDTLPDGTAYTRFEITDLATGEVEKQETTTEGSSFESGNEAVITEVDGVLKLSVDTKVTKALRF